jgi:hypothetical protein
MTRAAAIFDLDGTLAVIDHRLHHVRNGKRDWDSFFAGIGDDALAQPIARILDALVDDAAILLCSGRPEKCRAATVAWLEKHELAYDALYMRADGDHRPDHVVKSQILDGILADGFEPFVVIDDRQSVVDMWRERGLACLQCAPSHQLEGLARSAGLGAPVLTLMVGPSGAGKTLWLRSPWAQDYDIRPPHVISSDEVRTDLCGDFRDQNRNDDVFQAVHSLARARLRNGLPTTIDATHLRRKDRIAAAGIAGGGPVRYVVINRPVEHKLKSAGWRASVPGLIEKHEEVFQNNLRWILEGDSLPNVEVVDLRNAVPGYFRPARAGESLLRHATQAPADVIVRTGSKPAAFA